MPSWQAIIHGNADPDERPSFWRIYRLTITGYALNYATPVGGLGGEPYRIMELSRDMTKQHATSSVILYAMMHIFAHFWFWFTSVFLYLGLVLVGDLPLTPAMGIALGLIIVFCLVAFYLFSRGYRNGLVVKVIRWVGKIPGLKDWSKRFTEAHREALENVDRQIGALHRQDKRAFYSALLLEYLSRIVQHTHCGTDHPAGQPDRLPAHAARRAGRRLRHLHRRTRTLRRLRHLRQPHLPREGNRVDLYRHRFDEVAGKTRINNTTK